jgi:hypothetical protein
MIKNKAANTQKSNVSNQVNLTSPLELGLDGEGNFLGVEIKELTFKC